MFFRKLAFALSALSLVAGSSVSAAPKADAPGETIVIPFDPPIEDSLKYRWQRTDNRDGKITMRWMVNEFSFEEAEEGHRLSVKEISSGSNETDPDKLRIAAKLAGLMDLPYVLEINGDAEIVELKSADEYWNRIFQALREVLAKGDSSTDEAKAIEGVISLFQNMPAEVKLAKLTESVQPLVEFGNIEMTVGEPLAAEIEVSSPFGGVMKQNVVISLRKVVNDVAYLTVRSSVPREEFSKLVGTLFDKIAETNKKADADEIKKVMAAADQFKFETVADYEVSVSDGMLRSYQEERTVMMNSGKERVHQVRTSSLARMD